MEEDQEVDCVVVGPGLGRDENALTTLNHLIKVNAPLIVDADALLLLSDSKTMQNKINYKNMICQKSSIQPVTKVTPDVGDSNSIDI